MLFGIAARSEGHEMLMGIAVIATVALSYFLALRLVAASSPLPSK